MNINSIVKCNWLPLSTELLLDEITQLERLTLNAEIHSFEDIPNSIRARLSIEEQHYLVEKSAQISGNPTLLLSLLIKIQDRPPQDLIARNIWEERIFLKGFALSRLGKAIEAGSCFSYLSPKHRPLIQIERALQRLNDGDLNSAAALYAVSLKELSSLDPFSASSLLGGLSLAQMHLGNFSGAQQCIKRRKLILRKHPSSVLEFGSCLYEIMLQIEQHEFTQAKKHIQSALKENKKKSINGFFLLHLELRLHLARNELSSASKIINELKLLVVELEIPEGVLEFRLDEVELNLRLKQAQLAQSQINDLMKVAALTGNNFLHFQLLLLNAQALNQLGNFHQALATVDQVIEMGELYSYKPGLSWAFFHAIGIALAAGQHLRAGLYLNRGKRLSEQLRLHARQAIFSYMADILEKDSMPASALISLAKHQDIGPELEYFLDIYNLLGETNLLVTTQAGQSVVQEAHLRRALFSEAGTFWFQREGVLLTNLGEKQVTTVEFPARSTLLTAFRLFWSTLQNQNKGLSLQEIHKVRANTRYREELHGSATKMLISRLRDILKKHKLSIFYDRVKMNYSLRSEYSTYTIQRAEVKTEIDLKATRRDQVISRIKMEPFVSTTSLCEEFEISRQALNPLLQLLKEEGIIKLISRGPKSGYIYRGLK